MSGLHVAGPILATIAALAATRAVNAGLVLVTLVYVIGVGIPLFLFAAMGNRLFSKVRLLNKYTGRLQQFFGLIMLLTALAIFTNFDKTLQTKLLDLIPSYSVFLTRLESNPQVTQALNSLKGNPAANLSDFTPAADFTGITHWLNTDKPLTLADLKGRVVLVDFWTYTCINCLRTLPHVIGWYDKYKDAGFVVIGVHTPEFEFEKTTSNVQSAITRLGIPYPVAQDNNYATWNAYSNQYWPAEYLIDSQGRLRHSHFGEGDYPSTEMLIRSLLAEAGKNPSGALISVPDQTPTAAISPETYFGSARMQYYYPDGSLPNGARSFTLAVKPSRNNFSFGGTWSIADESAAAGTAAAINYDFTAAKVFVILRPGPASTNLVKVYLDNQPITSAQAGSDVHDGLVSVDSDRLYNVVALPGPAENHLLKLEFLTPGIQVFTFTFG